MDIRNLFTTEPLPDGFEYPQSFLQFIKSEPFPDLEPWWFLHKFAGTSEAWLKTVRQQYPERKLVPFAKVGHTDDVACFDASAPSNDPIVHYVHTYASPGWEGRGCVVNFDAWLKNANEESARWKAEGAEE